MMVGKMRGKDNVNADIGLSSLNVYEWALNYGIRFRGCEIF